MKSLTQLATIVTAIARALLALFQIGFARNQHERKESLILVASLDGRVTGSGPGCLTSDRSQQWAHSPNQTISP